MTLMSSITASIFVLLTGSHAFAQAKELKTEKDKPVAVLNLVNVTANCQSGAMAVPDIQTRPSNGTLLMQPRLVDVPAKGSCLAQKVPAITILYSPKKGFAGTDTVKIAIAIGEQRRELEYSIVVSEPGQRI